MVAERRQVQRNNHRLENFTGFKWGHYYKQGEVQKRKKDSLTRKTVLLTPGCAVLLKFGK